MNRCLRCGKESLLISSPLELCAACIRTHFPDVRLHVESVHGRIRELFGLPPRPPRSKGGLRCTLCTNRCLIPPGGMGACGTRTNLVGRIAGGGPDEGNLSWYHDPLPTNCVGDWVCPGGTGSGYPRYAHAKHGETGYRNLAVFFHSCSFNCLFCQNWHFREISVQRGKKHAEELVDAVDESTSCICFFGGDPTPQLPFAFRASRTARKKRKGRILRICWETNGSMSSRLLDAMADLSLASGGNIKVDLKAWDEGLHLALCGVSNRRTLANVRRLAERIPSRPDPPFLLASSLLVPGYVDEEEIAAIAGFLASLNPDIPYSLLAFHPHFFMADLPTTSRTHAWRCLEAARRAGLKRVRVGNIHLLGEDYA